MAEPHTFAIWRHVWRPENGLLKNTDMVLQKNTDIVLQKNTDIVLQKNTDMVLMKKCLQ